MKKQKIKKDKKKLSSAAKYAKKFFDSYMRAFAKELRNEINKSKLTVKDARNLGFAINRNFNEEEAIQHLQLSLQKNMDLNVKLKNLENYLEFFMDKYFNIILSIKNNLENTDELDEYFQNIVIDSIYELAIKQSSSIQELLESPDKQHIVNENKDGIAIRCAKEVLSFYKSLTDILQPEVSKVYVKLVEKFFPLVEIRLQNNEINAISRDFLNTEGMKRIVNFSLNVPSKLLQLEQQLSLLSVSSELSSEQLYVFNQMKQIKDQHSQKLKEFYEFWIDKIKQKSLLGIGHNNKIIAATIKLLDKDTMVNAAIEKIHELYRIAAEVAELSKKVTGFCKPINSLKKEYIENENTDQIEVRSLIDVIDPEEIILSNEEDNLSNEEEELDAIAQPIIDNSDEDQYEIDKLFPELSTKKKSLLRDILEGKELGLRDLNKIAMLPMSSEFDSSREGSRMALTFTNGESICIHTPHGRGRYLGKDKLSKPFQETIQHAAQKEIERKEQKLKATFV